MSRVVVVGAGLGGLRTAEALRSRGFEGGIAIVGAEQHRPYTRPPLSKAYLDGRDAADDIVLKPARDLGEVTWLLGQPAVAVDLGAARVSLADGCELPYDGLVVATGVRSRRLRLGGPARGRFALRTMDDAMALRAALLPRRRVVIVGAGFIGCEVASTARALGCPVTVVAPEAVAMERPLGRDLGAALQARHEHHGVEFRMGSGVAAFHGDGTVAAVELAGGEILAADVVVEAIGSTPNVEWLAGGTLDLTDGVHCDDRMRTVGAEHIVAVGDVARFPQTFFGGVTARIEHWSVPVDTARRAAATLAAELDGRTPDDEPFKPIPTFWSQQFDMRLQSIGLPALGAHDIRVLAGTLEDGIVVGYFHQGRLVGAIGTAGPREVLPFRARLMTEFGDGDQELLSSGSAAST